MSLNFWRQSPREVSGRSTESWVKSPWRTLVQVSKPFFKCFLCSPKLCHNQDLSNLQKLFNSRTSCSLINRFIVYFDWCYFSVLFWFTHILLWFLLVWTSKNYPELKIKCFIINDQVFYYKWRVFSKQEKRSSELWQWIFKFMGSVFKYFEDIYI